jgi:membrane-associated protease RseP (regulator of RpoE activity)
MQDNSARTQIVDRSWKFCARRTTAVIWLLVALGALGWAQAKKPISKNGLLEALRIGGLTSAELVRQVRTRGVEFELDSEAETELRKGGSSLELLQAVRSNYRPLGSYAKPVRPASPSDTPSVGLGLVVQDLTPALASSMGISNPRGVFVSAVEKGSLADDAGVDRRDVVTAINEVSIHDTESLKRQTARLRPGEAITLTVLRGGSIQKLSTTGANTSGKRLEKSGSQGISGKGKLGLRIEPPTPETETRFNLSKVKGMVVTEVDPSGPASLAGIRVGDIIEQVNGQTVHDMNDVAAALAKSNSGHVGLKIKRDGKSMNVDLQPRS